MLAPEITLPLPTFVFHDVVDRLDRSKSASVKFGSVSLSGTPHIDRRNAADARVDVLGGCQRLRA